jgi:hypothetical protein
MSFNDGKFNFTPEINGNLTLDMLYHPGLATVYSYCQYTSFVISSILISLTTYIVIKKSPEDMREYKYLILNQLLWSYLFDIILTFWQPVFLFPFFYAYSSGPAKLLSFKVSPVYMCLLILIGGGLIHSLYFSFIFRVAQVFPMTRMYIWMSDMLHLQKCFVSSLVGWQLFVSDMYCVIKKR